MIKKKMKMNNTPVTTFFFHPFNFFKITNLLHCVVCDKYCCKTGRIQIKKNEKKITTVMYNHNTLRRKFISVVNCLYMYFVFLLFQIPSCSYPDSLLYASISYQRCWCYSFWQTTDVRASFSYLNIQTSVINSFVV